MRYRKRKKERTEEGGLSAHEAEYGGALGSHLCHVSDMSLIIQPEPEQNEIYTIIDLLDIRIEGRVLVIDLRRLSYILGPRKSVDVRVGVALIRLPLKAELGPSAGLVT